MNQEYYSPVEAAEVLGVNREHILRLIKSGKIVASNIGTGQRAVYRISITEVQHYLKKNKLKTDEQPRTPEN
jgi:excisionase family DNA binding protein